MDGKNLAAGNMRERWDSIERVGTEWEQIAQLHTLSDRRLIDLGCGKADMTRLMAEAHPDCSIRAFEVDRLQHERNLQISDLPNVSFDLAGAEQIPEPDSSADVVFLFKSLHHVPVALLDQVWDELHRVLKTGGRAHISEPLFQGEFNEVLRLFHDESTVRSAAFESIQRAVASGRFVLECERFYLAPLRFADFEDFRQRILAVTHTNHRLSEQLFARVEEIFAAKMTADGAHFMAPQRIDVLRAVDLGCSR